MNELLERYVQMLVTTMDASGVWPLPGFYITEDGREFAEYALQPKQWLGVVKERLMEGDVREAVLGLDAYTKPGQGTTLDSCVVVFHLRGGKCRLGIWEYSWNEGSPQHKDINWENAHWRKTYAFVCETLERALRGQVREDTVFIKGTPVLIAG